MNERLRIAHCSDIHLDADGYHAGGDGARTYYRSAFDRAIEAMLAHRPDLLLIAGDLFDSNQASDDTVRWAMSRLAAVPVPVAMIPGNHDCLEPDAIYRRYDFAQVANLSLLAAEGGELRRVPGLDVAIWGRGMVDHHPDFKPLAGCPPRPEGCRWYLGMGHGIYVPRGESTGRSSPIRQQDIEASPCDYLALGHHHAALEVHAEQTAAAYSGSPTDSIGRGATYVVIDLQRAAGCEVAVHAITDVAG